eukprot:6094938-Prymnesium_polylepis.1
MWAVCNSQGTGAVASRSHTSASKPEGSEHDFRRAASRIFLPPGIGVASGVGPNGLAMVLRSDTMANQVMEYEETTSRRSKNEPTFSADPVPPKPEIDQLCRKYCRCVSNQSGVVPSRAE